MQGFAESEHHDRLGRRHHDWRDADRPEQQPDVRHQRQPPVRGGGLVHHEGVVHLNGVATADVGTATVADAPVAASAVPDFAVSAGSPLSSVAVAGWSDAAPDMLSSYSATIDWGDGTSSDGVIADGTVSGTHTYVNGGQFTITVTFRDKGGASATAHEQAVVTGLVPALLRRAATSGDLATWTAFINSGGTDEQVIAAIVSSPEYFARFNLPLAFPTAVILTSNTLSTTLTRDAALTLTVLRILPRSHASAVLVTAPRTKLVGVVPFGLHHKGRTKLHWNRKVHNHRLGSGHYLLILKAFRRHKPYHKPYLTRKLVGISGPVQLRIR